MDATLGQTPSDSQKRDAVHVAIVPGVAEFKTFPGEDVGVTADGKINKGNLIGIIDPFRVAPIPAGHPVYVVLYPNTINGMRHHCSY